MMQIQFNYLLKRLSLILVFILMAGCSTPSPMPFSVDSDPTKIGDENIYLLGITLANTFDEDYPIDLEVIKIKPADGEIVEFGIDSSGTYAIEPNDYIGIKHSGYLVRIALSEGVYEINGFRGGRASYPVAYGFFAPYIEDLKVESTGEIIYLGHIQATIRERQGEEFRAGSLFPILDQSVSGMSGGSFDIEVSDRYEQDIQRFIAQFPALKSREITKMILPPFDRARAQKFWEDN